MNVMCGMLHDDCDSMPLLYESSGSNRTIIHITVEAAKFFDNDDSDNESINSKGGRQGVNQRLLKERARLTALDSQINSQV